jgi:pimeloyl-ACP methyl ester carboxylesterase
MSYWTRNLAKDGDRRTRHRSRLISALFITSPIFVYVVLLNIFAHEMVYQFTQAEWSDPRFDIVTFDGAEGVELELGIHDAGPGSPTVMIFVGNVGSRAHFSALYAPLIDAGATVVAAPYRGAEGQGGAKREKLFREDATAAFEAIPAALGRDPGRVNAVGYSLGTGLALQVASGHDGGAVLLLAPYHRLCDVMTQKSYLPACYLPWIDRWDSSTFTGKPGGPVTILQGEDDTLIPIEQGKALADGLNQDGRLEEFSPLPGVGHNDILSNVKARGIISQWVKDFSAARKSP